MNEEEITLKMRDFAQIMQKSHDWATRAIEAERRLEEVQKQLLDIKEINRWLEDRIGEMLDREERQARA